ncbi:MAG: hypothetical protein AVDCRST_MAG18-3106 [uncultured Thermomicrobiales bacterium]|uniref:Uncharacterized protein n=1 Tax=uncultured Thermomicrobiales bacterium TaxID=1645740 RepID=A0A6J4VNL0_9BACT|nr:MAG: hypothetical protein AVDCRST_MAG18-3106 [uncultured Thermomicrobiales bacterium]
MARRLAIAVLLLATLGGCGGAPFVTATPSFARFSADDVMRGFKGAGLRVDGPQPLASGALGADAPRYAEAKSFAAGTPGSTTAATLFTFNSAAELTAMEAFLRQKYAKKNRMLVHRNVLLVFSTAGMEETGMYDPVLLGLR